MALYLKDAVCFVFFSVHAVIIYSEMDLFQYMYTNFRLFYLLALVYMNGSLYYWLRQYVTYLGVWFSLIRYYNLFAFFISHLNSKKHSYHINQDFFFKYRWKSILQSKWWMQSNVVEGERKLIEQNLGNVN